MNRVYLTKRAELVLNQSARAEAKKLGHTYIGPEHIFLGLLTERDGVAVKILSDFADIDLLRVELEKKLPNENAMSFQNYLHIIDLAREEARSFKHTYVGTEHILLALLDYKNTVVSELLEMFSIHYYSVEKEIYRLLDRPQDLYPKRKKRKM
ncbi:MAG: ATP-dependent Clp protease ATP-binding subunit [Leptospiraceae bacterium]|nr:ATP-dependent Clp protease ATP-binding subunit [Leptospiraceae bacterium]